MLPVLGEDYAPETAHDTIKSREVSEEEPCYGSKGRREDEEGEVRLCESKVKGNLP